MIPHQLRRLLPRAFSSTKASKPAPQPLVTDSKWAETPFSQQVFKTIGLQTFTTEELREAFKRIDVNGNNLIERDELGILCSHVSSEDVTKRECEEFAEKVWKYEMDQGEGIGITEEQFIKRTRALAKEVDPRVRPMALTFLASGIAIGVIIPVMPQLVKALDISSAEYGMIIGAFAATKLLANIPAAALVDRFGRKPCLTGGILTIGLSIAGVGMCNGFEQIMLCRGLTGVGVASFTTAATMYLTDLSTPLNRAQTMAPAMAAFSAGAACGPAVGGILADNLGFVGTFGTVGSAFALIALMNYLTITEIPQPIKKKTDPLEKSPTLLQQWKSLIQNPQVMNMTMLNGGYWFVLSGSQMTLLPLILVSDSFNFSASMVGGVFAGMSLIGVVMTPVAAKLIDSIGQVRSIIPACAAVSTAMLLVPMVDVPYPFLFLVFSWTTAGTILSVGPTAFITDTVSQEDRAQALALLRTGGDCGMLVGAITSGALAQMLSQPQAIQLNGAALVCITAYSGFRLMQNTKQP